MRRAVDQSGRRWHVRTAAVTAAVIIVAAASAATACSTDSGAGAAEATIPGPVTDLPPRIVEPPPPAQSSAAPPPLVAQQRLCGGLDVIDKLAQEIVSPPHDPGRPPQARPRGDVIPLANALNGVDRNALSEPMNAALAAHVYALTNLGALINHNAARDDIEAMATVADATGRTVHALCEAPAL